MEKNFSDKLFRRMQHSAKRPQNSALRKMLLFCRFHAEKKAEPPCGRPGIQLTLPFK